MFFAEGTKVINELINSHFELEHIYTTQNDFKGVDKSRLSIINESDLKKISALTTANTCLAVFKIPGLQPELPYEGLIVALDEVRDPGNMGTIIRLCDWFGIKNLVCSEGCVDVYNPKVVQATMGSIARVNVAYTNLNKYLEKAQIPIFGTFMDGKNIYSEQLPKNGIIIFGNEANGISVETEGRVTHKIAIPRFGDIQQTESLNVATATAIILSEFKRGLSEM